MSNVRKNQSNNIIKSHIILQGEFKLKTQLDNKDYLINNFTIIKDLNYNKY